MIIICFIAIMLIIVFYVVIINQPVGWNLFVE